MDDSSFLDKAITFYSCLTIPTLILNEDFELVWLSDYASKIYPQLTLKNGYSSQFEVERLTVIKAVLNQNKIYTLPCEFLSTSLFSSTLTPVFNDNVLTYIIVALSQAPEEANYDNNDVAQSIAAFSKQIREPLFYIFSALATISHRFESSEDYSSLEYVGSIYKNSYEILRTVTHVSDYSKDVNGLQSHNPRPMVFPTFIHDLYTAVESATRKTGIPFHLEMDNKSTYAVNFDEDRLSVAILNILLNSFLYTREGNNITLSLKLVGNSTVLTISDKGIGIPPHHIGQVFNSRFSYDSNHAPLYRSGLGLTIARNIIMQHGGTIAIDSEENVGTRVTVRLPVIDSTVCEDCFCTAPSGYLRNRFSPIFIELSEISTPPMT